MHTILSFGTIKQVVAVIIAIAIVVAAGIVVGQSPAIFGADINEDPEASIEFEDQHGDGTSVTVASVTLSDGGFVVVSDASGNILGTSEVLESGSHENVTVEQDTEAELDMIGELTATVHHDSTEDGEFVYEETNREEDRPYLQDGYPVTDTATVSTSERPGEPPVDSFSVTSVDGPPNATTTETIEFTGEVHNPAEYQRQSYAELRIGGTVLERQVLTLGAGETRELTFEGELGEMASGTYTYGVYTAEDGAHGQLDVEFDGPASVSAIEHNESSVTVDVGLPEGGFVAIEDDDDNVIGTSGTLDPDFHENVTVEFDDELEENQTVLVVAAEGSPEDLEDISAYEDDGERVETTVGIEVPEADDEADEADGGDAEGGGEADADDD